MSKRKHKTMTGIAVCTRRRGKQNTALPFLPRDIMLNILSRLPAEFLHNHVKYVSKTWANIIRDPLFIKMHLLHYSDDIGLLIQDYDDSCRSRYIGAKEGKIKVARPKYHIPGGIPLASYEGMSLLRPFKGYLYVGNCVTKQGLMLPCYHFATCKGPDVVPWAGFSRIPQSGVLKVIILCADFDELPHLHVLTVGTDKSWRKLECKFIKDEFETILGNPISINEIIYWPRRWRRDMKFPAVDLRDESIHSIQVPEELRSSGQCFADDEQSTYGILKMGNYLSCVVAGSSHMEINVWILKDMLSSRWVKIHTFECNVGLTVPVFRVGRHNYKPIAWLDNGGVLVFSRFRGIDKPCVYVVYNLITGKLRYIRNVSPTGIVLVLEHTNTLVSF